MTAPPSPTPRRLGFVGLGNIGGGVCANLLSDGHQVVVHDVDPARVGAMAELGGNPVGSVGEVAAQSQWTFLSLPTPEVMESVSRQWLEAQSGPGGVLVDLSTNSPATVRAVGDLLADSGCHLVEAPVTGGAPGARHRQLVFITGGDEQVVAEVTPLLLTLGRASFHLGPLGSGNVGKLVNSLVAFSTMWTALEGLALGAKNGVDLRSLVEMIKTSGAATPYIERRVEQIDQRGRPAEFALELAAKDAGLMVSSGLQAGVPMPVASALLQVLTFAKANELGGRDISDLVEVAERAAGVELRMGPAPAG